MFDLFLVEGEQPNGYDPPFEFWDRSWPDHVWQWLKDAGHDDKNTEQWVYVSHAGHDHGTLRCVISSLYDVEAMP